jgi:DNA-binding NarL/FixJ family response regulator
MCHRRRVTPVALIEDDPEYRAGVERLLARSGRFVVTGSFGTAEAALHALPSAPPAIVLCDIQLPGMPGPAAVLRLRETCPQTCCLMLTTFDDAESLFASLQAGAVGYLLKSAPGDLLAALDEALAGGAPMSRAIARRVLAAFERPASAAQAPAEKLTPRETEIMNSLARGLADKEIAGELGLSVATIKNHLYRVYEKLAVRSRTEAVLKWVGR